MMRWRLRILVQLAAMAGTAWSLIATSPARECIDSGPVSYAVQTTCGPSGELVVSNDTACELSVTGAAALNLPTGGTHMYDYKGTFTQSNFELRSCMESDNDCLTDAGQMVAHTDGGTGKRFTRCKFVPATLSDVDAGEPLPSFMIFCDTNDRRGSVCTGTATQTSP